MKRLNRFSVLCALLGVSSVLVAHPPAAQAAVSDPVGTICGVVTTADPTAEAGTQTGIIYGGPLVLADDTTNLPGSGTLTCRVQANVSDHTWVGPSVSGHGTGVVTAGPSVISYSAVPADSVYLCGEFTDDATGVTYFYDDVNDVWSTSPTTSCTLTTSNSGDESQFEKDNVDPVVCPILASLAPGVAGVVDIAPDGDVTVAGIDVWDCPPYAVFRSSGRGSDTRAAQSSHGGGPKAKQPYYPTGTITISSVVPGNVSVGYSGFNPPVNSWSCAASGLTVTCNPPGAPSGYRNLCGNVRADVTNSGVGTVEGHSHCTGPPSAAAVSVGPSTTPASDEKTTKSDVPWACEAAPTQALPAPWQVTCTLKLPPA